MTMPEQSVFYRTLRKRGKVSYLFFRFNNSPAFLGSWGPFLESSGNLRVHGPFSRETLSGPKLRFSKHP